MKATLRTRLRCASSGVTLRFVNAAATTRQNDFVTEASHATEAYLRLWMQASDSFRAWERREIFLAEPTKATLAEYRDSLKWMLRLARLLDGLVNDPDFPDRQFAVEIDGRLRQLQDSWDALNNPMTEAEADALTAQYFPDEPRS